MSKSKFLLIFLIVLIMSGCSSEEEMLVPFLASQL